MLEKFKKIFKESIDWLIIVLSVLFLFVLAYFNRFSADDYFFLHAIKEHSIIDIAKDMYANSSGRIMAVSLSAATALFIDNNFGLAIFNVFGFVLLFLAVRYLLSYFLEKESHRIRYSLYFTLLFVFASFSIGQNWFWMSAFFPHTLSFIFLLFIIGIILKKKRFWHYILGSVAALYIGNSSEIISIIFICAAFVYLVLRFRKKQKINCAILLFLFFIIGGFLLNYFSPGTAGRKELLANASQLSFIKAFMVSGFVVLKKTAISSLVILAFSFFIIPFWNKLDKKYHLYALLKRHFIKILLCYLVFVILYLVPIAFLFRDIGPDRIFLLFTSITAILISLFVAFIIKSINIDFIKPILILAALLFFTIQVKITQKYTLAYDKQVEVFKENKENLIQELPSSGLLYPNKISDDNSYFVNQFIKEYYQLKEEIKIEKD
jgi:Family of unknown function (DUF6056)